MACYEVVTDPVAVPAGSSLSEFRVPAPAGKVVFAGGWFSTTLDVLEASYPDGDEWVFVFKQKDGYDVDLYVTCL